MKYVKKTPRIPIKFINADTNEILFEIKDRTWMTMNELFADGIATAVMEQELKGKKLPKNLLILGVGEYELK